MPVFQCFFISVSILGGGVYFGELGRFDALQVRPTGMGACVRL